MFHDLVVSLYGETTWQVLVIVGYLAPIWVPVLSGIIFWELWVRYVRYLVFLQTEMVLLDIRLPREQFKSPVAMELVLLALHQTGGESTFLARYWRGFVRAWFSLEIVSIGGEVHFFVWTRKILRDVVEAQLYAQYPNIEITEAVDYTSMARYIPGVTDMWGCNYIYLKPDAYPIKTYTEYGLDKDPKEEVKNDPLTSILEFMGSAKPGEQVWLQFVVRAHKKEKRGGVLSEPTDWRPKAEAEVKKIHEKMKKDGRSRLSPGELEMVEAIERSLGKYPFDVGIRAIYYVESKANFRFQMTLGLRGLLRAFTSYNLNGFKPTKTTDFDFPWEDYRGIRLNRKKRRMMDAYKRRMFFFYPHKMKSLIMTNEELATMYHFPGQVALTPNLPRIPSKRSQAPTNLPT